MTITDTLARHSSEARGIALPEVREQAKKVIFDELACAYFGHRSAAGALAARYAMANGGADEGEARIYGTSLRARATFAALANGTAGHGEEVDGAHVVGGHPGASIVNGLMAMAERQRVTGAALVDAVILGYDIGVRIVRACGGKFRVRDTHNMTSDMFYAYGVTAGSALLLGLDARTTRHAFALTSFQSVGLNALYAEDRHISKSFCNGQFAFAGLSAALMAQAGLEGNEDIFGAKQGLLDAWGAEDGRDRLTAGLGETFEIMHANFKFFNAGYPVHTPVEAAMALVREHGLVAERMARVDIGMPDNARRVVDNRAMHNICVQDMVAASLASGGLSLLDQPFPSILENSAYRHLRPLIEVGTDPELDAENPNGRGARVTITTSEGKTFSRKVDSPKGHSTRGRVSWADLEEKWTGSLPGCDVAAAWQAAHALDDLDDVHSLAESFAGQMT